MHIDMILNRLSYTGLKNFKWLFDNNLIYQLII